MNQIFATIAAAHNIDAGRLETWMAKAGWDFTGLEQDNADAIAFVTNCISSHAAKIAAGDARKAAAVAAAEARKPAKTAAARANPEAACYKCDGVGKIYGFSHIANGDCFACGGAGVRRVRRCA